MSDYMITGPMDGDEVIGADARMELCGLAADLNKVFYDAGIRQRTRMINGALVCQMLVPTPTHNIVITSRVLLPDQSWDTVEIGAGKIRKKLKAVAKKTAKVAKKIANSKVMKKLAKVVGPIAAVVPGMQGVAAGLAVAKAAKTVVKAAKKGHPKAKVLLKAAVRGGRVKLAASAGGGRYRVTQPSGSESMVDA
jgi:hypothetical protein